MKAAAAVFFWLLVFAHLAGDPVEMLALPLSPFRDGENAWLGYLLFAVLLLVGGLYVAALWRRSDRAARYRRLYVAARQREGEAAVATLALALLLVVALTESWGLLHLTCSLLVLVLLYGYYALLLYRAGSAWFIAHVTMPILLLLATQGHSYGLWQKTFIVYCVLAAVIHHHLLGQPEPMRQNRRAQPLRKRKVYTLEVRRAWGRRGAAGSSA
jgi:hypothetical protein